MTSAWKASASGGESGEVGVETQTVVQEQVEGTGTGGTGKGKKGKGKQKQTLFTLGSFPAA